VNVTVVEPPQAKGAPVLLLVKTPRQGLTTETVANQAAYFALMAAWDWHGPSVASIGQISTTPSGASTVKVAIQVVVNGAQLLV